MAENEIRIYGGITPNGDGDYYVFDNVKKYLTFLEEYKKVTLPVNSYRLNDNLLIISTTDTNIAVYEFTYVAEVFPDKRDAMRPTAARFWRVQRVVKQSGKAYLTLQPDYFANGIDKASFDYLRALRSNVFLGEDVPMFYDDPAKVDNVYYKTLAPAEFAEGDCYIVLLVALETWKSSAAGQSNNTTANMLFAFDLSALSTTHEYGKGTILQAVENAGTLYQWKTGTGIFENFLDAKTLRAWIVPKAWMPQLVNLGQGDAEFTFRDLGASSDMTIRTGSYGGVVRPGCLDVVLSTGLTADELAANKIFAGTATHLIELPRLARRDTVTFRVKTDTGGIKVLLLDNGTETDITDAFEVYLSSDENVQTYSQQIANAVRFLGTAGLSAGKAYAKHGGVGALGSLIGSYLDGWAVNANTQASDKQGHGDALNTYFELVTTPSATYPDRTDFNLKLRYPLQLGLAREWGGFYNRVTFRGASTDYLLDVGDSAYTALKSVAECSGLVSGRPESTFLHADCAVLGLPEAERLAIQAALAKGMWYKCIE